MKADLLKINPNNPGTRKINTVISCLNSGGIVIYPTDTIYGLGCDFKNKKAIERISQLKGIKSDKLKLSLICKDLSNLSYYAKIDKPTFRVMNQCLPGPYTFILPASSHVPKMLSKKKKEIGIRIPNNNIINLICKQLGNPLINTSIKNDDEILNYYTDPFDIFETYKKQVDLVIDGGVGKNEPSTIVNCLNNNIELIRQGLGEVIW